MEKKPIQPQKKTFQVSSSAYNNDNREKKNTNNHDDLGYYY